MLETLFVVILIIGVVTLLIRSQKKEPPSRPDETEPLPRMQFPKKSGNSSPSSVPPRRTAPSTASAAPGHSIKGAAYIIDGDSLRIKGTEIRLFGVDAPEFNHPFGKKAKWELVRLCKGQQISAEIVATDDHGRTVANCSLPDGRDLSAEMVKAGLALDWPKFSNGKYRKYETDDARRKLWLADARQKGRMHVWAKFEAQQKARRET